MSVQARNYKSLAVASLIKSFKKNGIHIDRVGLQSHFISSSSPSYNQAIANMAQFTSLGVEVTITEFDVRVNLPGYAAKEVQQAFRLCKRTQSMQGY